MSDFTFKTAVYRQATDAAARVTMYKEILSLNTDVIGLADTHLNSRDTITHNTVNDNFRRP